MWVILKIPFLLWAINLAPPLLAHLFRGKWDTPIDRGQYFRDSKPVFGSHKTIRGALGGTLTGAVAGNLIGLPVWLGLIAGALSMIGDLISSFVKRRFNQASGRNTPGLDQFFEGLLPFCALGPYYSLHATQIIGLLFVFCFGAYVGSWGFHRMLLTRPVQLYSRSLSPLLRFREWRACQTVDSPLHPLLNFERGIYYHILLRALFKVSGLYERGRLNALNVQEKTFTCYFRQLPPGFENYRILFLSDLHLDGLTGLTERLQAIVGRQPVDLCILGGDFRTQLFGSFKTVFVRLRRLIADIQAPDGIYAILGNHDCLEMLEPLRDSRINFLVNDAVAIRRRGEHIWLVGVDDPHYYRAHNLQRAFQQVPAEAFSILAAHSPELFREAGKFDPRLYLCGHTHAGQIQLPKIGPIFTHCRAPRRLSHGMWQHGNMLGYTSAGSGVSGVPVRFGCRGEVVVITLKRYTAEQEKIFWR